MERRPLLKGLRSDYWAISAILTMDRSADHLMKTALIIASTICGLAAATLWFWASAMKLTDGWVVYDHSPEGEPLSQWDEDGFFQALKRQSRINAAAAGLTAAAVLFQTALSMLT